MEPLPLDIRTHRRNAAVIAVAYIAIQVVQFVVMWRMPAAGDAVGELLQGRQPLNLARSALLLLSFFGLTYMYLVVCAANVANNALLSVAAFVGFLLFCFCEIGLRSVELYYVQLRLPEMYQAATGNADRERVLAAVAGFQSVQYALYFPLLLGQALASLALSLSFAGRGRNAAIISFALGLNGVRLMIRLGGMYLNVSLLDRLSNNPVLYLILVGAIYGGIAAGLLMPRDSPRQTAAAI